MKKKTPAKAKKRSPPKARSSKFCWGADDVEIRRMVNGVVMRVDPKSGRLFAEPFVEVLAEIEREANEGDGPGTVPGPRWEPRPRPSRNAAVESLRALEEAHDAAVDSGDTEHAKSIARTIGDTRAALERDAAPRTANQAKKSKASARHARVVALARQRHPRLTNLQIAEEAGYRDERTVEKILTAQGVKRRRV